MKINALSFICAASVYSVTAHAAVLFQEDFEAYALDSQLNGQGGWTADTTNANTYKIVTSTYTGSKAVDSGNNVSEAAMSHAFDTTAAAGETIYLGLDFDYSAGATNFYWVMASDDADYFNSAGATFSNSGTPTARARNYSSSGGFNAPYTNYGDPARIVIEISASGGLGSSYDTTRVWSSDSESYISTIVGDTGVNALDTFFARRGSDTNGNRVFIDNIVVATTFDEAALIPEPSSLMSGTALLGLGLIRKRKR